MLEQCEKIKRFVAGKLANPCVVKNPLSKNPQLIGTQKMFTMEEKKLLNKLLKNTNSKLADNDFMDEDQKKTTSELLRSINKKIIESEESISPNDIKVMINGKAYTTNLMKS